MPNRYHICFVLYIQHNVVDAISCITPGHLVCHFGSARSEYLSGIPVCMVTTYKFVFCLFFACRTLLWAVFISHLFTCCAILVRSAGSASLIGIPVQLVQGQQGLLSGLLDILHTTHSERSYYLNNTC